MPNHAMLKLSVIIASYNMRECLEQCLASVRKQRVDEMEILVVDDGSTDDTAAFLRNYAKKHPECRPVILEKRGGVSHARNVGIDKASGEYIHFVDADDLVPDGAYRNVLGLAMEDHADIVTANYEYHSSTEKRVVAYQGTSGMRRCLDNNNLSLWNKLFRREFLLSHSLLLDERMDTAEDAMFVLNALRKAPTISYSDANLYVYQYDALDSTRHKERDLKLASLENSLRVLRENFSEPFPEELVDAWQRAYDNYIGFVYNNIWQKMHVLQNRSLGFEKIKETLLAVEASNPDCNQLLTENDIRFRAVFPCDYATFLSISYAQFLMLRSLRAPAQLQPYVPVGSISGQFVINCANGRVGIHTILQATKAWCGYKWRKLRHKL